jgi:predicted nucleotidyltransferase
MYTKENKLKITENHLKVLSLFTRGFNREYYIREIPKLLGIGPRTAQLILNDLEEKGVLESETRGKIRTYRLKKGITTKEYLIFSEQYKTIVFLESHLLIKEIVEKIYENIKGIALIFGSYAKGTEKEDSDLDMLIIGKHDEEAIKKVACTYGREISIKSYSLSAFKKNMKSHLIVEVLCNHIVIRGVEDFINMVVV